MAVDDFNASLSTPGTPRGKGSAIARPFGTPGNVKSSSTASSFMPPPPPPQIWESTAAGGISSKSGKSGKKGASSKTGSSKKGGSKAGTKGGRPGTAGKSVATAGALEGAVESGCITTSFGTKSNEFWVELEDYFVSVKETDLAVFLEKVRLLYRAHLCLLFCIFFFFFCIMGLMVMMMMMMMLMMIRGAAHR